MPERSELPKNARPGDILLVVHNFEARGADELTLRRGNKVELLELDDGFGDGWYLGRHLGENRTGLFPGVYTTITPKIGVRNPSESSLTASESEETKRGEVVVEVDKEPVSPVSADEITPQASRHVSAVDMELLGETSFKPHDDSNGASLPPTAQRTVPSTSKQTTPSIQRTISETLGSHMNGEESPVLNETLSVIDEHITNFSTPRHSLVARDNTVMSDSSSEYSSFLDHRMSYIRGIETDEEEEPLTEAEVRKWDQHRMTQHLREIGVDPRHCSIFESQEITGDVLLDMDQEFIYMKDFDFGVMGRRLKTWHKIRAFQEEIQGKGHARHSGSTPSEDADRSHTRSVLSGSFLPRIPSVSEKHHQSQRSSRDNSARLPRVSADISAPSSLMRTHTLDSSSKPSADLIRQNNHHRHSSIDNMSVSPLQDKKAFSASRKAPIPPHEQKASFDRGWTMNGSEPRPSTALATASPKPPVSSFARPDSVHVDSPRALSVSVDQDRGYFSGGEIDGRRTRNVLRKRDSSKRSFSHSRHGSSVGGDHDALRRHSRFGSTGSVRDLTVKSLHPRAFKTHSRDPSTSPREMVEVESHSPTVTNLEPNSNSPTGFFSSFVSSHSKGSREGSGRSSPLPSSHFKSVAPKVRRAMGFRASSDVGAGNEKTQLGSPESSPLKESPRSSTRTNSSTSKSLDVESRESSSKILEGLALMPVAKPTTQRARSKKETSAYRNGLEKKTPQEQMEGADFYGWMKKKSSNLMTTWKPRLFILKGRRLSYYYSEEDTEERGLIDISSHRVFRVDQDTITSLHATLTGAKASPTSPLGSNNLFPDAQGDETPPEGSKKSSSSDSPFIFKLVPPKTGLSRAVQFTKPAVHFFQVDNIQLGRKWMAAIMKATIERDQNLPVRTTNKQKTIPLKQARLLQHGIPQSPVNARPKTLDPKAAENLKRTRPSEGDGNQNGAEEDFHKIGELDTGPSSLFPEYSAPNRTQST
ncbi:polar growth protein [Myotisia sp. PD_48]|nr:polar growth protein [Myotisia sp. PD_48]